MKRAVAGAAAFLLMALVIWAASGRDSDEQLAGAAPQTGSVHERPQQCIDRLFTAAERGDVQSYLDCFTGTEREQLEKEVHRVGSEEFARSLMQATAELKGLAVVDARTNDGNGAAAEGNRQAQMVVERVYQHHHEKQCYHLVRNGQRWQITAVLPTDKLLPAVPYGTPVFAEAPDSPKNSSR